MRVRDVSSASFSRMHEDGDLAEVRAHATKKTKLKKKKEEEEGKEGRKK